jgi:tetratricopeptide (TPR) repeat protein
MCVSPASVSPPRRTIELARRWQARAERGVTIEEGDAWALNIQAYAHDSLGQTGSADAVFEQLAAVDADQHYWVVNFVINRASRLVGQGRWSEGLTATELARTVAETQGTVYAKALIARDRACALQKLGRAEEAAVELAYLRENWREGVGSAVEGLLCHGQRDEAVGLLLQALRDDQLRSLALSAFIQPELDLFYSASILPTARSLLEDRPELATELARHVRPIPQAYIPQASLRRIRVPLPTW